TTRPDGSVEFYNGRWYAYTGLTPGGPSWSLGAVAHPDDAPHTLSLWRASLASGEPFEHEVRLRRASDDAYRWFITRAEPLRDEAGQIVRWFGTCTDIHDIRDAEEALRESDERLRLVGLATNDAVWDWDMRTDRFVTNPAFGELFGWRDEAAAGFDNAWMVQRMHPDDRAYVFDTFRAIVAGTGTSWSDEHRFERADGTWADVLERGYIVRENGVPIRTVGSMLDLSPRKEMERALVEARDAAEAVARTKSSLLMNMSHEIRTPLTAVIGYAELLADEFGPEQAAQREYVAAIEKGGRRLLSTLNSVLDLAQIEAGALPLATVAVDLRVEVEAALAALQPLAQARGLALTSAGPSTAARADRAALARVLTNLVGNAIKFTDRGTVDVVVWAEDEHAWFRVTDTGAGIDPEFLTHVFGQFTQESSGANRSHEGSGLGLAITQGLVTMMGGEISAASEKGVGSTFTVRLPAP
ncbi:MAG TPA: PAS domain-containing sensor histidine kinase, partial [Rhodothermales bacterium]|nr:PAS domain-containing sensor histidine kinase [Rhodothermales bacterium]